MKAVSIFAVMGLANVFFAGNVLAGVGCDLNLRLNNKTANAVTIVAAQSQASKAGLKVWNSIDGLEDVVLNPEAQGTSSHSKQAVELALPCWTGKVDFRIKYLTGAVDRWVYRNDVSIESGDTIQINVQ